MVQQWQGWQSVTENGAFSIKKAYMKLLGTHSKVSWRGLVCNNLASPKSVFILWLMVQNRLATRDRLLSWKIQCSAACGLCDSADESVEHLFYQCSYIQAVRLQVFGMFGLGVLPPGSWTEVIQFFSKITKKKLFCFGSTRSPI